MSEEYVLWKHDLRHALRHLCRIDACLRRDASETESPGERFRTAMNVLYLECRFEQFFALRAWEQAGLDQEAGQQLQTLKSLIDAFDEPDSDAAIVAHPQWHAIVQQSRQLEAHLT